MKIQWSITSYLSERLLSKNLQTVSAREDMEKREPFLHCYWDCKSIQPLWKAVWRFLIKLKIELSHVSAINEQSQCTPRENYNSKRHMYPNVHCNTIYNGKTWKQYKCSLTEEWIKKMCGTLIQCNIVQP